MIQPRDFFIAAWDITLEMAPALLLGLLLAALIHEFIPRRFIRRRLAKNRFRSVFDAVLIGVPMPLCSCGVVPTAISLKKDGASNGAATGFLISTPQTGVDSILVSASFLGWPFAIFKVVAAAVTGLIGGAVVTATEKPADASADVMVDPPEPEHKQGLARLIDVADYAVFELLAMIDLWLLIGIGVAAAIAIAVPTGYLETVGWTQGIVGMLVALAISMPLYVCTTSSVPIAASLIAAGMPLGTALVFLMAGPATNVATVGMIYRGLGGRVLGVYLGTVAVMSIAFGLTFDWVLGGVAGEVMLHDHGAGWVSILSALLLSGLVAFLLARRVKVHIQSRGKIHAAVGGVSLQVSGMTCMNCAGAVKKAAESVPGVSEAIVQLDEGTVTILGDHPRADLVIERIRAAGYKVG